MDEGGGRRLRDRLVMVAAFLDGPNMCWPDPPLNPTSAVGVGGLTNFVFSLPTLPPPPARGMGLPLLLLVWEGAGSGS